jgi:hypothetical protein
LLGLSARAWAKCFSAAGQCHQAVRLAKRRILRQCGGGGASHLAERFLWRHLAEERPEVMGARHRGIGRRIGGINFHRACERRDRLFKAGLAGVVHPLEVRLL